MNPINAFLDGIRQHRDAEEANYDQRADRQSQVRRRRERFERLQCLAALATAAVPPTSHPNWLEIEKRVMAALEAARNLTTWDRLQPIDHPQVRIDDGELRVFTGRFSTDLSRDEEYERQWQDLAFALEEAILPLERLTASSQLTSFSKDGADTFSDTSKNPPKKKSRGPRNKQEFAAIERALRKGQKMNLSQVESVQQFMDVDVDEANNLLRTYRRHKNRKTV